MIRVNHGYTVVAFPQRYDGKDIANRVEVRDEQNQTVATLWTGLLLADAWTTAERHIEAVEAHRREVAT